MKKFAGRLAALGLALALTLTPASALTLDQARELLDVYYVDDIPQQALQADTLEDFLAALGDPYTVYMTQEEYEEFTGSMNDQQVVGIGAAIQNGEGGLLISSVIEGSPALEAGLQPGDLILAVDGTPVTTIEEGTALITGEEGTTVRLLIRRADGSETEVELVRRAVVVPTTVQYAFTEDGRAGLVVCNSFGEGTAEHLMEAMGQAPDTLNAWIIDLTANPGGTSVASAAAAGWFIGGAVMAYFRDGQGQYNYTYTMPYTPVLTDKPAILLTGPYSASGAELFSAAIRDHGAGISIGQRTFGKGVAQVMLTQDNFPQYFDGDALKVTVYRFFSPQGTTNDQLGVLPTLMVSLDNTVNAALLLCSDEPERAAGHLKVILAGWEFYIDLDQAVSEEYRAAFTELLEAMPPAALLAMGTGGGWLSTTPADVAEELGLDFESRSFTDVEGTPYAHAVDTLAVYGLVGGYGDGTFRPGQEISRAEFCAMLCNLLGLTSQETGRFTDVAAESWYSGAVHAACAFGLMGGYGDGTFRPEQPITQEEIVCVLANLGEWLNMNIYEDARLSWGGEDLASYSQYSSWARQAALLLDRAGALIPDLDPQADAVRGVAAQCLYALLAGTGTHVLWE